MVSAFGLFLLGLGRIELVQFALLTLQIVCTFSTRVRMLELKVEELEKTEAFIIPAPITLDPDREFPAPPVDLADLKNTNAWGYDV